MAAQKTLQQKFTPLQKKNFLFLALAVQLVLSVLTFTLYYFATYTQTANFFTQEITKYLHTENVQTVMPWLFTVYLLAFTYKLTQAVYAWYCFKKESNRSLIKPAAALKIFALTKQHHFGIKRKVQLWLSHTINTPVTYGFLKPVIVLPVALINKITMQQAEALILHELAHIKANDYLLNWFLISMEIIFFFNPFVLHLCKNIKLEREKYCDITVTAFNYAPLVYAEVLVLAQQRKKKMPQYQLAAAGLAMPLYSRIQFFTNPKNQLQQNGKRWLFTAVTAALLLLSGIALFFQVSFMAKLQAAALPPASTTVALQTENQLPVFVNNIIASFTEEKLKAIVETAEKEAPLLEKKIQQLQPLLKKIEAKAEKIAADIEENFALPATLQQNDATKQIIVREEESGSLNATIKVYNIVFKNGQWQLLPQFKLAAKEIIADSLHTLTDTSDLYIENSSQQQ